MQPKNFEINDIAYLWTQELYQQGINWSKIFSNINSTWSEGNKICQQMSAWKSHFDFFKLYLKL